LNLVHYILNDEIEASGHGFLKNFSGGVKRNHGNFDGMAHPWAENRSQLCAYHYTAVFGDTHYR
jgi:hypothetical protein